MTEQVEETLQQIADVALRGDGDHVHVVNYILDPVRYCHLSGHRSCQSFFANLATDDQCHHSCQRQYELYSTVPSLRDFDISPEFFG